MHQKTLEELRHAHHYFAINEAGERSTWQVVVLTVIMMVIEISAGMLYNSMALLADGWHMGTHALALGITAFAYYYSRKYAHDPRYSFGTGKIGVLGGYTSAVFLGIVAVAMIIESFQRLFSPESIRFNEAILVAVIGLIVNLVSALILQKGHGNHDHHGHHHHDHGHHAHGQSDHNLRAAYLHVIADALTSFLAIFALMAGKYFGWIWMDPAMGIVGALVISKWALGLLRETGRILLDFNMHHRLITEMGETLEAEADTRVSDMHVWKIGSDQYASIISLVTHHPKTPQHYKNLLTNFPNIAHVSIEINPCQDESCGLGND